MVEEVYTPPQAADQVRPLFVGVEVPDVSFTTIDGETLNLKAAVAQKPTILNFYRGDW